MDENIIQTKFPYLCIARMENSGKVIIGVVQNCTKDLISMYVYSDISSQNGRKEFLRLCDIWWWESNRQIPINIFLKQDFARFKSCLRKYSTKELNIISGHIIKLSNYYEKRAKKKNIIFPHSPNESSKIG